MIRQEGVEDQAAWALLHERPDIEEAQIIREYDFEKIRMLMEDAK